VFHTSLRRGFELAGDSHEESVRQKGEIIGKGRGEKLRGGRVSGYLTPAQAG
jgi:hypothetical protein